MRNALRGNLSRYAVRLGLGLGLGLATTLGVAWGAAWRARDWTTSEAPRYWFDASGTWLVRTHAGGCVTRVSVVPGGGVLTPELVPPESIVGEGGVPRDVRAVARGSGAGSGVGSGEALMGWRVGWPWRALACVQYSSRLTKHDTRTPAVRTPLAEGGIVLVRGGVASTVLPWRPIAGGLIGNTLVYGVVWAGVIVGVGGAVRLRRCARGLCPACAYDLRGRVDACPECGWGR